MGLFLSHLPLLRLPYFWDEAGYYIPAARDLWLAGELIPHSTPSNAHPPLVMAYLALWWKIAGFAPVVTRTAMLFAAAFSLLGIFRLAQRIANCEVAVASTICCALYPVFFAQSTLAHLDLAAAGLIFWGLHAYVEERWSAAVAWFSVSALAKETAILVPLALIVWEAVSSLARSEARHRRKSLSLLLPVIPLGVWYCYHFWQTGYVFGNPEFFRYNVQGTLHPLRILIALLMRLWQAVGYMNLFALTVAALLAMWRPPVTQSMGEAGTAGGRPALRLRITLDIQFAFLVVAVV
ncbi:MAG TPA: glycosyltransferase family 39 protein, partial [Terriglobales bacterium]